MSFRYKNDFLDYFKNELKTLIKNNNTRKNYIYEIKKAFSNQEFNDIKNFEHDKLKNYIQNIKTKKSASTLKHALKMFSKTFDDFPYKSYESFLNSEIKKKSNNRTTKWQPLKLSTILKKINAIKDKKLKLGYRTIFATGLRIEELSNLKKKNIIFKDGKLFIEVEKGKNNKKRIVETIKDKYLEESLKKHIKTLKDNDRLFYKMKHILEKSNDLGFMTHDLRRTFSKIIFSSHYRKGIENSKTDAIKELQKRLGHEENTNTYKKYLSRKINFNNTKWKNII